MHAQKITLHGHDVTFRMAGDGPVLVLLHGITSTSETWREVMPALAERHTVLAPDLLGHGESAKPRGDYSLGAYASGVRDLMAALDLDRGTIVGHSLGGGVAMQFAYQFPERLDRLVLVSSGGLGRSVHLMLRAAALPGADLVLPLIAGDWLPRLTGAVEGALKRIGLRTRTDIVEAAQGYGSLADAEARAAFLHTVRAAIDPGGQRVSARDRLYLAEDVPTLIIWGERDGIIPIAHGRRAHEEIPDSRFVEVPGAGHWPQLDDPALFVRELERFVDETEPADLTEETLRARLRDHGLVPEALT
jgi:pimeloyl-ACP methyl ester carboxylesterase